MAVAHEKNSTGMAGVFALPADLEHAMALGHIRLVKRVCTYAITHNSTDLVRHGHPLCPETKPLKQRLG